MESLGLVLARGGSKGIPNKNLVKLAGKPLLAHTIEAALESRLDRVVVSTDSPEIADVARDYGADVPFMRPAHLATDDATSYEATVHALDTLKREGYLPDVFIRLQPTSPFRTPQDINEALRLLLRGAGAVVAVTEAPKPITLHVYVDDEGALRHVVGNEIRCPRQALPTDYVITGSIYAAHTDYWRECRGMWGPRTWPMVVPKPRAMDIDDPFDLKLARAVA